ncbi:MAG: hypothetical protein R2883_07180 [Caldisericia bacterium]
MEKGNGYEHKTIKPVRFASKRFHLSEKSGIREKIDEIKALCGSELTGDAICIYRFGTINEGLDVEIGFRVPEDFESKSLQTRTIPQVNVVSYIHSNGLESLTTSIRETYKYTSDNKFIVDEYYIEIWHDNGDIEIQIPLHNWHDLFLTNLKKNVENSKVAKIISDMDSINVFSPIEDRFEWIKGVTSKLEKTTDKDCHYQVISKCAHIFPVDLIKKARRQFESNPDVDNLITFMKKESGWYGNIERDGDKVITWKNPANPKQYAVAKTKEEKINAYCFCPIVKFDPNKIPYSFCNCSAGWVRQLWEGVFETSIQVNVDETIISGAERCSFSFIIPGRSSL